MRNGITMSETYHIELFFDNDRIEENIIETILSSLYAIKFQIEKKGIHPTSDFQGTPDNQKSKKKMTALIHSQGGRIEGRGYGIDMVYFHNRLDLLPEYEYGPLMRYSKIHLYLNEYQVNENGWDKYDLLLRDLCKCLQPELGLFYYYQTGDNVEKFIEGKTAILDLTSLRVFYFDKSLEKYFPSGVKSLASKYHLEDMKHGWFGLAKPES